MVRNVLFVDDDRVMLSAIEKRFSVYSESFGMVMANDGFEAVKKLKSNAISLIVLDLKMPRMDGMSLLAHAREKYPDIPVIIVSGYRTAEMYKLAKSQGVIAYISKPFQVDDLGKLILSTLQKEADGGIMHKVSPPVFMQLMEMEGKSCTIRLLDSKSGQSGILYFKEGSLLDSRVGELKGIDAAYRIFSWDNVTIFIQNECADREDVIKSDLQPIIMRAASMKDEEEGMDGFDEDDEDEDEEEEHDVPVAEEISEESGDLPGIPDSFFDDDSSTLGKSIVEDIESVATSETPPPPPPPKSKPQKVAPPPPPPRPSKGEIVQSMLQRSFGKSAGVIDIYEDSTMGNRVSFLQELGAMFDFGKLKVGYLDDGMDDIKIMLPDDKTTTVVKVGRRSPHDAILQQLKDNL